MTSLEFQVDGHVYRTCLLNEPEVDIDPTFLLFRDLEEEALLTIHLDPETRCAEHVVARPFEDE